MKKRLKIPKYHSELFSIESILVENNSLCIRGDRYGEGVLLGTQYSIDGFSFICDDATELADFLNTDVESLAEHIRYSVKGHIDLLYDYCQKHGLTCRMEYSDDAIQYPYVF